MKIKRIYRNGTEFFSDEHGNLVTRNQIKAVSNSGKTVGFINESANLTPEEIEALTAESDHAGASKSAKDTRRKTQLMNESDTAGRYYHRVDGRGDDFYVDSEGTIVDEATARRGGIAESNNGASRGQRFTESASDTTALKTMAGHFVRENSSGKGANALYLVVSVNDDGTATLYGPIGKGPQTTVTHDHLFKNYTDLGNSLQESERIRGGQRSRPDSVGLIESAPDTAAAKTLVGHFVRDNSAGYGSTGMYKVASVDDDGSATLKGPIGQGGTKTVSHSNLVKNHTDMGDSADLSQVNESERFNRRKQLHIAAGLSEAEAEIAARGR